MRSFQFRLRRVLDWYRKKEEIEEARLAACQNTLVGVEGKIAKLMAERAASDRELLVLSTVAAADFVNLSRYRLGARRLEGEYAQERQRCELACRQQMERVQKAQQQVKLLEKMKERRAEEHEYLSNRELESLAAEGFLATWAVRAMDGGVEADRPAPPDAALVH
jgi:flagellar biosynthesis chaperone FliJ